MTTILEMEARIERLRNALRTIEHLTRKSSLTDSEKLHDIRGVARVELEGGGK